MYLVNTLLYLYEYKYAFVMYSYSDLCTKYEYV